MNVELISVFAESVLAFFALVVAIIQVNGERRTQKEEIREREKREEEKRTIDIILKEAKKAESCKEVMANFRGFIDGISRRSDSDPQSVMDLFDQALEDYENKFQEIKPSLEKLYEELLINEEKFPMAYGYGRYITEVSAILDFDAVLRERRMLGYDSARMQVHQILTDVWNEGGELDPDSAQAVGELTEHMVQALEPYYKHAQRINTLLFELGTKYSRHRKSD